MAGGRRVGESPPRVSVCVCVPVFFPDSIPRCLIKLIAPSYYYYGFVSHSLSLFLSFFLPSFFGFFYKSMIWKIAAEASVIVGSR